MLAVTDRVAGIYLLRWVTQKGQVREEWHDDLASAFVGLYEADNNERIEYVELVADKGYDAPVREGRKLVGAAAIAAWIKEPS